MSQLLQNALYGTALILAAALLRRVLKDRLIPEARLALWGVCLFRLLTPIAPTSVLSLWGLFGRIAPEGQTFVSTPAAGPSTMSHLPPAETALPQVWDPGTTPEAAGVKPAPFPWEKVLLVVWLAVGAALAVWYVLSYARTRRAVGRTIPVRQDDLRYAALPRRARLREGPMDGAPLTFGVVRPTVVLSPGLDGAELECVLAHEGVHVSRRDNLWHYATAAALIVFWWDPAVWLMTRLLRRDVELACDRAAVKRLGTEKRAEYANTLVSMATQGDDPAFCQTFGRKAAEERIISVMKYKKMTIIGAALTLALVLAVTVGFASNPAAKDVPEEDGSGQSANDWAWTVTTYNTGALRTLTVDLGYLEEDLARHVADGTMTQAEADRVWAFAKAASTDGVTLDCAFRAGSGLVHHLDPEDPIFPIYLMDGAGDLHHMDPATVISEFVFGEDSLIPVMGVSGNVGYARQDDLDGWGGIVRDPEEAMEYMAWLKTQPAYQFIPVYDAQGNVIDQFAIYNSEGTGGYVESGAVCTRQDCGDTGVHTHDGASYMGWTDKTSVQFPVCPVAGCTMTGAHTHDGATAYACSGAGHDGGACDGSCYFYFDDVGHEVCGLQPAGEHGLAHDPQGPEDSAGAGDEPIFAYPTAEHSSEHHDEPIGCPPESIDQGWAFGPHTAADCGLEGCTVDGLHGHSGSDTFTMGPICPREDCDLWGSHDHDGVMYSCNGNHHDGGVCDGSCYSYNEPAKYVDPPQTASPSVSSGHHGESHHSESHHSSGHH